MAKLTKKAEKEKATRDLIVAQALREIQFARTYKQGKVGNWKINEDLYYGRKPASVDSVANVDLGQMASFVHTILSKVDNPLTFKFTKRKDAQLKRVQMLNALKQQDQQDDDWDIKDIVGKKQGVIYGRAIFSYFADSYNGYCPHLDNVDVYDFLIDPSAGGIDIERAMYLGRYGVVKTKKELEDGVADGIYIKTEADTLIEGNGNANEMSQEETNKRNRTNDTNVNNTTKEIGDPDKYKFWEWYTTYEGERYYLLLTESGGCAIRVEKLSDMFESNLWPFWTWAVFPDLTEFWTPSFCDYVREIFMAQAVSINQMLDNAEQINKPQKIVHVGAIEDLAQLKYRRNGLIKVKKEFADVRAVYQKVETPEIKTPLEVFKILDAIQEKASGVTAAAKGVSEQDKVGINDADLAASADRFGYLNKSYSFGTKRFAKLYEEGVKEHLSKKVAVDVLGPNGVEIIEVSRRDIFRKGDRFGVMVDSSNAEIALSEADKKIKLAFLTANQENPVQNRKKAYEISASIAGFDDDTIRQLQDTSEFGTAAIMSEAERDIEALLDGEEVKPNPGANTAYKQRFVDYIQANEEKISKDQFDRIVEYIAKVDPIIVKNMVRQANDLLMKAQIQSASQVPGGGPPGDAVKNVDVSKTTEFAPQETVAPELETPTVVGA